MNSAIIVVACLTLLVLFLALGATRELYGDILAFRRGAGFIDEPTPIDVNTGLPVAELEVQGLRELVSGRAIVLIISDRCMACYEVLARVPLYRSDRFFVLVNARSLQGAESWLARHGLTRGEHIAYDALGLMSVQLGVTISPAIVRLQEGFPISGSTVPSARQLDKMLEWLT